LKFDVDLGFVPPPLPGQLGRWERLPEQRLVTSYFDTADHRLWAAGLTLRHRSGEEEGGGRWTLKLPVPGDGPTLDRTELTWDGTRAHVPAEVTRVVLGITRSSPVGRLVELHAVRSRSVLRDPAGRRLGELDDDSVTVTGGDRDGARFRQIEFEVGAEYTAAVGQMHELLERAGGRSSGGPKLAKAVALSTPPWRTTVELAGTATIGQVVQRACGQALDRLTGADLLIRLDGEDPPMEAVHRARVATRRLRSDLKVLSPGLEEEWVRPLRAELKWLGSVLGRVRDDDVLGKVFEAEADGSAFDAGGRDELRRRLARERQEACRSLGSVLTDARYLGLLEALERAAERGPTGPEGAVEPSGPAAGPAAPLLERGIRKRQRALQRSVRRAGRRPSDLQMHGLRIRAKELRYAAEMATPVLGAPARRTAGQVEAIQVVLGDYHDTVTAEAWLRHEAEEGSAAAGYSAGRMAAEQCRLRRRVRRRWNAMWRQVDHAWETARR
jgi:CHAD domain-containing protein